MTILLPWMLLLLLVPFWASRRFVRREPAVRCPALLVLGDEIKVGRKVYFKNFIERFLQGAFWVCLCAGISQPTLLPDPAENRIDARDIVLALDVSASMKAIDFESSNQQISRLDALKECVRKLIELRRGDRIGLVVFGEHASTQSPLTLDQQILQERTKRLFPGMAGDGTALGDGLALSLKRLRATGQRSKVIVLFSDGKNTTGRIAPGEASRIARSQGVRIHTVGLGADHLDTQSLSGSSERKIPEYDRNSLQQIAEETGGFFFEAADTETLRNVSRQIDDIESRGVLQKNSSQSLSLAPILYALSLVCGIFLLVGRCRFFKVSP